MYRLLFGCVLQYLVASKQVKACPVLNVRAKYQLWIAKPQWVLKVYFQDVSVNCYECQAHAFPDLTVPLGLTGQDKESKQPNVDIIEQGSRTQSNVHGQHGQFYRGVRGYISIS